LVVGAAAYLISFSTGTAWGTMGILCPLTVEITARIAGDLPVNEAMSLLYAAVGSVLGGAVFGNHCSPIADVTVLSTLASGCPYEEHLWTQLPYVLLVGLAGLVFGDTFCGLYGQPWLYGILLGAIFLALVIFVIGRRPAASFDPAHA
jgi:Na+/H+ antiporter NhaC